MKLTKEQIQEWIEPSEATKARWKEMDRKREEALQQLALEEFLRERERMEKRRMLRDLLGI